MNTEIAIAWQRLNALGTSALRLLPNLVIALLLFLLFLRSRSHSRRSRRRIQ